MLGSQKFWTIAVIVVFGASQANATEPSNAEMDRAVDLFYAITDTVLDHHLQPPSRQQMLLDAIRQIYGSEKIPPPIRLGREVSQLATRQQFRAYLTKHLTTLETTDASSLRDTLAEAILVGLPGGGRYISAEDLRVEQQLRDNLYVGIGIRLGQAKNYPAIMAVLPRGPAKKAGCRSADLIIEIDGESTEGQSPTQTVNRLRGPIGSRVRIVVRQDDEAEQREIEIVRGVVPIDSVVGWTAIDETKWDYRASEDDLDRTIAYIKVGAIKGSTVHELRQVARRLRREGFSAIVIDLSTASRGELRHAVMLADSMLDAGLIGRTKEAGRVREYKANANRLFPDWPMAVVIGPRMSPEALWIADALVHRRRAKSFGRIATSTNNVKSLIVLPAGFGAVELDTAELRFHDPVLNTENVVRNAQLSMAFEGVDTTRTGGPTRRAQQLSYWRADSAPLPAAIGYLRKTLELGR